MPVCKHGSAFPNSFNTAWNLIFALGVWEARGPAQEPQQEPSLCQLTGMDSLNLGLLLTLHPEPVKVRSQPVPFHCSRLCLEGQKNPKWLLAAETDFLLAGGHFLPGSQYVLTDKVPATALASHQDCPETKAMCPHTRRLLPSGLAQALATTTATRVWRGKKEGFSLLRSLSATASLLL